MTRPFGLVLAGGQARRMGGADKALLPLNEQTIMARIAERLHAQCNGFAVSANGPLSRWAPHTDLILSDVTPGRAGPLAGVLAGLAHLKAKGRSETLLLTVPGDAPFLPDDLVDRLWTAREQAGAATSVAASGGRLHPVAALWSVGVRDRLEDALAGGLRGVLAFHALVGYATAVWPVEPLDPFFNVNTPEDLQEAERLARLSGL